MIHNQNLPDTAEKSGIKDEIVYGGHIAGCRKGDGIGRVGEDIGCRRCPSLFMSATLGRR